MNLDDIVAIRAVRTAHGMHMPEQIHPMSEREHNKQLPSNKSDGHWLAGDVGEDDGDEQQNDFENETSSRKENVNEGDGSGAIRGSDDDNEMNEDILEVLRAALSPHPFPKTSSTSPSRLELEALSLRSYSIVATNNTYRVISRGTASTIYSSPSYPSSALEIGRDEKALWNDICIGIEVYDTLSASRVVLGNHFHDLTIPLVSGIQFSITPAYVSQWWANSASQFGPEDREKHNGKFVFGLDRIPPVPSAAAEALLDSYFSDSSAHQLLLQNEAHACLMRPYLGRRRTSREKRNGGETLWNYSLFLDQLLYIVGIEGVKHIARELAVGLAVLHWGALVDGMDIEFVFGGTSTSSSGFEMKRSQRATQLWPLNFDRAAKLQLRRLDGKV